MWGLDYSWPGQSIGELAPELGTSSCPSMKHSTYLFAVQHSSHTGPANTFNMPAALSWRYFHLPWPQFPPLQMGEMVCNLFSASKETTASLIWGQRCAWRSFTVWTFCELSLNTHLPYDPDILLLYSKEIKTCPHNSPKLEITQMPINRWMNKQNVTPSIQWTTT